MKHEKPSVIHTARLCLSEITEGDADAVIGLLTNEEVGKTYMVPDFTSCEDALPLFRAFRRLSLASDRFVYGIRLGDTLIGLINDVEIPDGEIELGFVIDPAHKNRGYATEVLSAAMQALFDVGYSVVRTGAFSENAASIRVMEKCGMVRLSVADTVEYRGKSHRCVWFEKRRACEG